MKGQSWVEFLYMKNSTKNLIIIEKVSIEINVKNMYFTIVKSQE